MAVKVLCRKQVFSTAFRHVRQYSAPADRSIPAAKQKYVPSEGTYPKGFLVGTAHAGVKPSNTQYDDIALVVSEQPCPAAAVFTKNVFEAAPVLKSRHTLGLKHGDGIRGVVVNSGCANAVTGKQGIEDATRMACETDKCFGDEPIAGEPQTLVMSTGVIGQRLPIQRIIEAIPRAHQDLGSSHEQWLKAAQAICTTDTFPKLLSRTFTLPSHPETEYRIAGMTKGAGMIHPNMGTLLGIVCTDVKIANYAMRPLLRYATIRSFNCISIDGETSTNDTVALLANGAAAPADARGIEAFSEEFWNSPDKLEPDLAKFRKVLTDFLTDLAKLVVRDGEGATKFVTIRVRSTDGLSTAKRGALHIARSSLVKTALYGKDANWGRIVCALGHAYSPSKAGPFPAPVPVNLERTSISFVPADGSPDLKLLVRGEPEEVDEERAKQILEMEDLEILVDLNDTEDRPVEDRNCEAVYWTCDLSHEYVTINGDYRT